MRSRLPLFACLLLTISSATVAQENFNATTCDLHNGRAWGTWEENTRLIFLIGVGDTLARLATQGVIGTKDYFPSGPGSTYVNLSAGIDRIYIDPANLSLPILDALSAASARANGMSPDQLEKELARLRRTWLERGCKN